MTPEFFKNFDQNTGRELQWQIQTTSRILIKILVGNAAVADCDIVIELFKNFHKNTGSKI